MAEATETVTVETVRDYIVSRGGVVKNVDLVKYFRSFLQQENPEKKAQARTLFKDYVNAIASIKLENGEKYLVLKPHIQQEVGIGSPRQPQPFSPGELLDSPDGGMLSSPLSLSQSMPPKQSRVAQHTPAGKPPLAQPLQPAPTGQEVHKYKQQQPRTSPQQQQPHPPQQEPQSPAQHQQMSVSPLISSNRTAPRSHSPPGEPPPPPRPLANQEHLNDNKKFSASTDSLERIGGLQSSVPRKRSPARRSGSFNYADHRHSLTGRPPVIVAASGRLSPRNVSGKGRFVIPGGPGLEERKSMFENHNKRTTMTPTQRKKAGQSFQPSIKQSGSRDSNLAVVGTEAANNDWDETSSIGTSASAVEYEGLDPTEHEWINASTDADVDTIHRLLMVDPTLVNRKDFFMGYTATHWGAIHGRVDMVTGLMLNGALPDIKSNGGFTPLHLAAQRGHDSVIYTLVREHGARADIRENSGRLPIDLLKATASDASRALLETGLKNYGLRRKPVAEARRPVRKMSGGSSTLATARMWSSMGDIVEGEDDTDEKRKKRGRSANLLRRLSMRKDRKKAYMSEVYDSEDSYSPSIDRRKHGRQHKAQSELLTVPMS